MSKKLLFGVIIVLLITNVATLLFWTNDENAKVTIDKNDKEINTKEAVATIDGKKISFKDWIDALRANYGEKELKAMIDRSIVEQLAHEKNITVNDKVIDREVALLTSMQGVLKKEELEKKEKQWREDVEYRYQLEALLTEDTVIPEEEIQSYYNSYSKQYDLSTTVQLSHIIVDTMETAEKVKKELDDGASFSLLAQEYSTDEETRDDGGYLGYFIHSSQFLPNGYYEKASQMEEHSYSEPFAADNGVAIIYFHRMLPEIKFSYDEIKPYIKSELALDKLGQSLAADPLWKKVDIDWIYDE